MGLVCVFTTLFGSGEGSSAQGILSSNSSRQEIRIISVKGKVEVLRAGLRQPASNGMLLNPGDDLETGEYSSATIRWYGSEVQMSEMTRKRILPMRAGEKRARLSLLQGLIYLFHRERPGEDEIQTPAAWAAIMWQTSSGTPHSRANATPVKGCRRASPRSLWRA